MDPKDLIAPAAALAGVGVSQLITLAISRSNRSDSRRTTTRPAVERALEVFHSQPVDREQLPIELGKDIETIADRKYRISLLTAMSVYNSTNSLLNMGEDASRWESRKIGIAVSSAWLRDDRLPRGVWRRIRRWNRSLRYLDQQREEMHAWQLEAEHGYKQPPTGKVVVLWRKALRPFQKFRWWARKHSVNFWLYFFRR